MTLAEAEANLATINAALEQLYKGKRITRLVIGFGASQQVVEYHQITIDFLLSEAQRYREIISNLSTVKEDISYRNATIYLDVSKRV